VGSAPYAPATVFDHPGADGAQRCFNHYHEYGATPGCGGVDLSFTLLDAATYDPYSRAGATATVTRTYGCAGAHRTRTVLRKTTDVTFQNVYIPDLGYWTAADGSARLELFYAAPAEDVTCRPGEEARHLSTRVSRLVLKIISSQQTIRSWRRAGNLNAKTPERV
jgi:hypothetical protein